jgi:hypothetical protein
MFNPAPRCRDLLMDRTLRQRRRDDGASGRASGRGVPDRAGDRIEVLYEGGVDPTLVYLPGIHRRSTSPSA